ncbi:type II toxin-antitoxin system RelE/ParE family toxin [Proteiniphilum sp.]|uniref:type II toxin-antitoxin system RelE/ParE family toxin n=1 Tax=Proteiniphilum sp. TaxID=1926877 RepID=UPI00331D2747
MLRIKNGNFFFFKNYFEEFYENQSDKVKKKIVWTLRVIEEIDQIPEIYLKHLSDTTGLYEIRIQVGNNIYRIFCFFDLGNIIVVGHGFHKKTQKTPKQQIERAEQIKKEYYESKK